jgi:hypothetical protein
MFRTRSWLVVVCAAALGLASPVPALASGEWAWPVDGSVTVGYGATYVLQQGASCTHGGVDVGAAEGTTVRACVAGEVTFSGLVPAGEGARAWAVTVLTADGLRVTYLPLRRASVSKGEDVGSGAALGELAASGDASSPAAHLHLGVRRGETRLDPLSFLGERAPQAETPLPTPAPTVAPRSPVPAPQAPAATHPAGVPTSASARMSVSAPVRAGSPAPASEPAAAPAASALPLSLGERAALPSLPVLRAVPLVADPPRLRTAAVAADIGSTRDFLLGLLARLGLVGLAGACAWPVMRHVLDGSAARAPVAAPARSHRV